MPTFVLGDSMLYLSWVVGSPFGVGPVEWDIKFVSKIRV
jgi:hypothetical protein